MGKETGLLALSLCCTHVARSICHVETIHWVDDAKQDEVASCEVPQAARARFPRVGLQVAAQRCSVQHAGELGFA